MSEERTWAREAVEAAILQLAGGLDTVEGSVVEAVLARFEALVEAEAHAARSGQLLVEVRDAMGHESRMDGVRLKAAQEAVRAARRDG